MLSNANFLLFIKSLKFDKWVSVGNFQLQRKLAPRCSKWFLPTRQKDGGLETFSSRSFGAFHTLAATTMKGLTSDFLKKMFLSFIYLDVLQIPGNSEL